MLRNLSLRGVLCVMLLLGAITPPVVNAGGGRDDPVMAGYDVVAYHSLDPNDVGRSGSDRYQTRYKGYLYYFSSQANMEEFQAQPEKYVPAYGGFCAWGIAWEYQEDGWPWAADHMGPPCGPRDGWAILTDDQGEKRLYCSIWRSYQDDFNSKQEEGIRLANQRWIDFYGSLDAGPFNNGCYAWNWQECFAESIYDPNNPILPEEDNTSPSTPPTSAPTSLATLFSANETSKLTTKWSEPVKAMGESLTFQYTLENVASVRPLLIVDLVYELPTEDEETSSTTREYVGFGVAEQVMQGALVVCFPSSLAGGDTTAVGKAAVDVTSTCTTYMGAGMAVSEPDSDPVMPTVRTSSVNATHYHVQFSANLFACWSNPAWPARVLFSHGQVSGNGDPMPHRNSPLHRQAVEGVPFLSVVDHIGEPEGVFVQDPEGPPAPLPLEPLPEGGVQAVEGTSGSLRILDGRVALDYGLFEYGDNVTEEVVHVEVAFLNNDEEISYVGFGFAEDTMSGLVIVCVPHFNKCEQWRGLGTNLYPRSPRETDQGWHVLDTKSNETHVIYALAGRVRDVIGTNKDDQMTSQTNLRAIAATGRATTDTGTPLMHSSSRDRTPLFLNELSSAVTAKANVVSAAAIKETDTTVSLASTSASTYMSTNTMVAMASIFLCVALYAE